MTYDNESVGRVDVNMRFLHPVPIRAWRRDRDSGRNDGVLTHSCLTGQARLDLYNADWILGDLAVSGGYFPSVKQGVGDEERWVVDNPVHLCDGL